MNRANDLYQRLIKQGDAYIEELIEQRVSEELFLDFKRSATDRSRTFLDNKDRANLAKAISGFGNSEGGVIVWGIDCRTRADGRDAAEGRFPIENPGRFKSWLEGAISGCTVPPHAGVQHSTIIPEATPDVGYVVTLIPPAPNLPIQVATEKTYYLRAGSNFERIPHGVLAGLFGRPPAPTLKHFWTMQQVRRGENHENTMYVLATLGVLNEGPGLARELFASINIVNKLRKPCRVRVSAAQGIDHLTQFGQLHSTIAPDVRPLPPGGIISLLNIELDLPEPPQSALRLECSIGCGNGAPHAFIVHAEPEQLASIRNEFFLAMPTAQTYDAKRAKPHGEKIFKLQPA